jgi:hypothetical protein
MTNYQSPVIPAKAGIPWGQTAFAITQEDSRWRGNDGVARWE